MAIAEELILVVRAQVQDAIKNMDQVTNRTNKLLRTGEKFKAMGEQLTRFGRRYTMFVTAPILAATGASVKFAANMEQQTVAFETMLRSADKAAKLFDQITEFSATTPFQMPDLIEGSKRLLAFGTASENVVQTMRNLGNLAMGNAEKLDRLVDAYGKVQARGKASMRELNMFMYSGVPIVEALANSIGVTTNEIFKMSEQLF